MPVTYQITEPKINLTTYEVPYTLFTGQNHGVNISFGNGGSLPVGTRILGVVVHKEVAFDTNTISFGTDITTGTHSNLANAAEVAATTSGVVLPIAWQASDGAANLLLTGARAVYARLGAGSLPTVGLIRLTLLTWRLTSRSVL